MANESEQSGGHTTTVIVKHDASNALGIASFIFGLISIFFLSPLFVAIALILGIIAVIKKQLVWGVLGPICACGRLNNKGRKMDGRNISLTIMLVVMIASTIEDAFAERLIAHVCWMGNECVKQYLISSRRLNDKVKVRIRDVQVSDGIIEEGNPRDLTISCKARPPGDHSHAVEYTLWMDVCRGEKTEWSPEATKVGAPTPSATGTPSAKEGQTQIGLLKHIAFPGCGCYFSPVVPRGKKVFDKYLFISDATGKAYINIDGRDTVLQEVGRKQTKDEDGYCAGKRCTFSANGVKTTVDFHETEKCPSEPTECEITGYDVTITVEKGSLKQRVKGKGFCGC